MILTSDPLLSEVTALLRSDAGEHLARLDSAVLASPRAPVPLQADLSQPLTLEIFAELTAMYLYWTATMSGADRRLIYNTVGLLRESKAKILSMREADLKNYRGRSLVTLFIQHAFDMHQDSTKASDRSPSPISPQPPVFVPPPSMPDRSLSPVQTETKVPPPKIFQKWILASHAPNIKCMRCGGSGHSLSICKSDIPPNKNMHCFCCKGVGHYAHLCPSPKVPK
jgi:hypothetical protein